MRDGRHDQATGLRRLFARETLQVLSVRGGIHSNATAVTLDLAVALVALGHHPLIIDLEIGQAAIALGFTPRYELAHVLCGDKSLSEVLLKARGGVSVLPATRGLEQAAQRGAWQQVLGKLLADTPQTFNVWLVNGATGPVGEGKSPLLVIAPTRDGMTGAYAQIKSLARDHGQRDFRVVVDHAVSESVALCAYTSIAETSRRFLAARLSYCGYLPQAEGEAIQRPTTQVRVVDPHSPRAHAFSRLAEAVLATIPATPQYTAQNLRR